MKTKTKKITLIVALILGFSIVTALVILNSFRASRRAPSADATWFLHSLHRIQQASFQDNESYLINELITLNIAGKKTGQSLMSGTSLISSREVSEA